MSIYSKYYDINDFNKLNISLLKHSVDIIGMEHKINKSAMNADFALLGYTFYFNETESSHGGTDFFYF